MDGTGEVLKEARPSTEKAFKAGFRPVELLVGARSAKKSKTSKMNLALIEAVFDPKEEDFKALRKVAKKKKVDKEIKALFDDMIVTWPIKKVMDETGKAIDAAQQKRDRTAYNAAQDDRNEKLYTLFKKGVKVENEANSMFTDFWMGVANACIEHKDKDNGNKAIDLLIKQFEGNERAISYFEGLRKKLG